MIKPAADSGFAASVLSTTGDEINGYRPPGILDGTAAWRWDADTVRVFVNHEFGADHCYPYRLDNGVTLTGGRISWFDIDANTRQLRDAGLAFRAIYDRRGELVRSSQQINEKWGEQIDDGLHTLCSAQGFRAGQFGFVDDLMFTHEEVSALENLHPHGGSVWALDVQNGELWALPNLGRGSWENSTAIATPDQDQPDGRIALVIADDLEFGGAPLYLWVGRKRPTGNFPERNGLVDGQLYAWSADDGWTSPSDWCGTGKQANGQFIPLNVRDAARAGESGFDRDGYLNDDLLRAQAESRGAFFMSRPEDVHTNPANPNEVVLCSTGQGDRYPEDDWGTIYLVNVVVPIDSTKLPSARLQILDDCDDAEGLGIRSPDNLVWASDDQVYVQEDSATKLNNFFTPSQLESSIWRINPRDGNDRELIATLDRSVVLPADARDVKADRPAVWESSGILDVSREFGTTGELLLLATVQAHTIREGSLGDISDLFQGGQLILLSRKA